jgi:hypothetical protein
MGVRKLADMSMAAKKAWKTRRERYGEKGLSKPRKPEVPVEKKDDETVEKEVRKSGYFCVCGAGPFKKSIQKAQHVRHCEEAKARKS